MQQLRAPHIKSDGSIFPTHLIPILITWVLFLRGITCFPTSLIRALLNNLILMLPWTCNVCFETRYPLSGLIPQWLIRYSVSQDALSVKCWTTHICLLMENDSFILELGHNAKSTSLIIWPSGNTSQQRLVANAAQLYYWINYMCWFERI